MIDREAEMIERLGVQSFQHPVGKDVTLEQLRSEGFEAFLLAIGAHEAYKMLVPGEEDFPQVTNAVQFLRRVALGDRRAPGGRIAVIGGGNVAIDAARTCIRLGCEQVTIVYRRTRSEMPAHEEEIIQAEEEGITFSYLTVPKEIVGYNGKVTCIFNVSERNWGSPMRKAGGGQWRWREANTFWKSMPLYQQSAKLWTVNACNPSRNSNGPSENHPGQQYHLATSLDGVFAAGDVVSGPATVVEAIVAEKKLPKPLTATCRGSLSRKCRPCRSGDVGWNASRSRLPRR